MKPAYYILTVTVLALVALAAVFISLPPRPATRQQPARQMVYVNVDRLVGLHPSSATLKQMRFLLASSVGRAPKVSLPTTHRFESRPLSKAISFPDANRNELELDVAQAATEALDSLESDELRALKARLTASRSVMMENARSEIMAQIRQIDQTAALNQRSLVAQVGPDRLTAQIRADALRSSLAMMSTLTGAKPEDAKFGDSMETLFGREKNAETELKQFSQTIAAESVSITTNASDQVTKIRQAAADKINAEIASIENQEKAKIQEAIAGARNEILDELNASDQNLDADLVGSLFAAGGAEVIVAQHPKSMPAVSDAAALRSRFAAVETMIRADIKRAVTRLADADGVRVVFVRSNRRLPDATSRFAHELRTESLPIWSPVVAGASALAQGRG